MNDKFIKFREHPAIRENAITKLRSKYSNNKKKNNNLDTKRSVDTELMISISVWSLYFMVA